MPTCFSTTSQATVTVISATTLPTERSKTPVDSGTTSASAMMAIVAFSLQIDFAVSQVGNVSGASALNRITIASSTYTAPKRSTRDTRTTRDSVDSRSASVAGVATWVIAHSP